MAVQGMTQSLAGLDMGNDKTADYKKLIEYGLDANADGYCWCKEE